LPTEPRRKPFRLRPAPRTPNDPEPAGLPRLLRSLSTVLAPTTLVTALLFFFGARHANWFCRYFGVHYTVLEFSPQDYLIRAVDGLFVPVAAFGVAGIVVIWTVRFLRARLSPSAWTATLRVLIPTAIVAGVILACIGLVGIVDPVRLYDYPGLPGVSLALGFLLFPTAERLAQVRSGRRRRLSGPQVAFTFILVSVGLFWATNDYSLAVGERRAIDYQGALPGMPDAVLISTEPLGITGPGVAETACDYAGKPSYRYDGLVLVLQSGDHLFLLPKTWTEATGGALVLPQTDSLRIEFNLPPGPAPQSC
jgi:hypothetical protein